MIFPHTYKKLCTQFKYCHSNFWPGRKCIYNKYSDILLLLYVIISTEWICCEAEWDTWLYKFIIFYVLVRLSQLSKIPHIKAQSKYVGKSELRIIYWHNNLNEAWESRNNFCSIKRPHSLHILTELFWKSTSCFQMLSVETEAYDLGYKLSSGCTVWLIGKYYQYMSCVVSESSFIQGWFLG